jgi:hypothetical protein
VLHGHGAELVAHGHNHRNTVVLQLSASGAPIPIVGVASASQAVHHKHEPLARYNLYRIEGPPWRVELLARALCAADGTFGEIERRQLIEA